VRVDPPWLSHARVQQVVDMRLVGAACLVATPALGASRRSLQASTTKSKCFEVSVQSSNAFNRSLILALRTLHSLPLSALDAVISSVP
jgi:hypothetical protein